MDISLLLFSATNPDKPKKAKTGDKNGHPSENGDHQAGIGDLIEPVLVLFLGKGSGKREIGLISFVIVRCDGVFVAIPNYSGCAHKDDVPGVDSNRSPQAQSIRKDCYRQSLGPPNYRVTANDAATESAIPFFDTGRFIDYTSE